MYVKIISKDLVCQTKVVFYIASVWKISTLLLHDFSREGLQLVCVLGEGDIF